MSFVHVESLCGSPAAWQRFEKSKGPAVGRTVGEGGEQRPGGQPVLGSQTPSPLHPQHLQTVWLSSLSTCIVER